jgi:hypothetical protein
MRATEYTLKNRMAITHSMKAIDDSLKITRIEPKSSTPKWIF